MKLNIILLTVLASNLLGLVTTALPSVYSWDVSNISLSTGNTPHPFQSSKAETIRIQPHTKSKIKSRASTPPIPRAPTHNHNSSHQPRTLTFDNACGLKKPTAELWVTYQNLLKPFMKKNWDEFMDNTATDSFAMYLRDKYAPKMSPSSLFCDVVGECSIGSCLNLSDDFSTEERQLVYLVFEQMAGVAHVMQASARATDIAGSYILSQTGWLVDTFSSARRIEQALKTKSAARKIGMAAGSAFGLMAAGGFAAPGTLIEAPAWLGTPNVAVSIIVNGYVGAVGIVNAMSEEIPDLDDDLESWLTFTLNEIIHKRATNIDDDLRNLMTGKANHKNMTIFDILTNEEFLGPDPGLQSILTQKEEQFLFAVAVNAVWRFDRPYLIDSNVPFGGCRNDFRGHPNYRVCLKEFPTKSFWLYNIGQGRENDFMHDEQAQVSGPSGFHRFDVASPRMYHITREDVVRSSLFVHRNKLADAVEGINIPTIGEAFKKEGITLPDNDGVHWPNEPEKVRLLGLVPGAFAVPVCRNPGGEAISSVNTDKSRNYPCMCGEFRWTYGWSEWKDETPRFLEGTGFMFSEDWEDYCSGPQQCIGQNSIDMHAALNAKRKDGDPGIPKKLKHPFKMCKKPKSHSHYGHPEKDL